MGSWSFQSDPISAGAGLVGSIISGWQQRKAQEQANIANLQIMRENNAAQLAAMRENNQFQSEQAIKMFQMENEYNSPYNALIRARKAGLNPYAGNAAGQSLVQGAQGDASTPTGTAPPQFHSAEMQPLPSVLGSVFQNFQAIASGLKMLKEAKKTGIDTSLLQRQFDDFVEMTRTDMRMKRVQEQTARLELGFLGDKRQAEIDQIRQAIAVAYAEEAKLRQDVATGKAQESQLKEDAAYKRIQRVAERYNITLTSKQIKRIDAMLPGELQIQGAQKRAYEGSAAAGFGAATESYANARNTDIKSDILELTKDAVIKRANEDAEIASEYKRSLVFENYLKQHSIDDMLKMISNQVKITEAEYQRLYQEARVAKATADWYPFEQTFGRIIGAGSNVLAAWFIKNGLQPKPIKVTGFR